MYTHLVLGGGGVKGCVLTGALEAMDKIFNINRIKYIIGSSAGGVIGLFIGIEFYSTRNDYYIFKYKFN